MAVGKTKPVSALREVYDAGQRHFGENYVQELVDKSPLVRGVDCRDGGNGGQEGGRRAQTIR